MSMGGHQSARQQTETWLTPPEILASLGPFDLDPCCPSNMPWQTAHTAWTPDDDGLSRPWFGRVWLNPPWGRKATPWIKRLAGHGNGVALLPARTETKMFFDSVWGKAEAVLFIKGRPHFHFLDGSKAPANCGCPVALVAYGKENAGDLKRNSLGVCVSWRKP
jgi:hypothetical protein